jgi:hypothetical protein
VQYYQARPRAAEQAVMSTAPNYPAMLKPISRKKEINTGNDWPASGWIVNFAPASTKLAILLRVICAQIVRY